MLAAMGPGGLPFTTKTAYIVIRGAVNSGRLQLAEQCAAMFQVGAAACRFGRFF